MPQLPRPNRRKFARQMSVVPPGDPTESAKDKRANYAGEQEKPRRNVADLCVRFCAAGTRWLMRVTRAARIRGYNLAGFTRNFVPFVGTTFLLTRAGREIDFCCSRGMIKLMARKGEGRVIFFTLLIYSRSESGWTIGAWVHVKSRERENRIENG